MSDLDIIKVKFCPSKLIKSQIFHSIICFIQTYIYIFYIYMNIYPIEKKKIKKKLKNTRKI